jgi:transposase
VTETEHHLIIAHEVTNHVGDRGQLPKMAAKAKAVLGFAEIDVLADTGYFNSPDLLACHEIGVHALVPRPNTSNAKAAGRFSKAEFVYLPDQDAYRCPAGEMLPRYCLTKENDLTLIVYRTAACSGCPLKERCTTGQERRVRRWEHEAVLRSRR